MGTNAWANAPSANKRLNKFGNISAVANASISGPWPPKCALATKSRANPRIRLASVSDACTNVLRARLKGRTPGGRRAASSLLRGAGGIEATALLCAVMKRLSARRGRPRRGWRLFRGIRIGGAQDRFQFVAQSRNALDGGDLPACFVRYIEDVAGPFAVGVDVCAGDRNARVGEHAR